MKNNDISSNNEFKTIDNNDIPLKEVINKQLTEITNIKNLNTNLEKDLSNAEKLFGD